jgi:ESX secretion-associated protein EspG
VGETIELSVLEFDVLWEHFRLGPLPPVLEINSHGATHGERAELTAKAWATLAERDLARPGKPDSRLGPRLGVLARPGWEVDARIHRQPGQPRTSALIATVGRAAVIAVLDADRLTLRTAPADRLAHHAVALLPPHRPGTGASITLPADTLDAAGARAGDNPDALARALESQGLGRAEARKIAEVAGGVTRFTQLGAARTRPHEPRRRAGHVVSVYDTTTGRYLFTRKPGVGRRWVTLIPGPDTAIVRQLAELLAELNRP